jgi:hypothetical protein
VGYNMPSGPDTDKAWGVVGYLVLAVIVVVVAVGVRSFIHL